MTTTTHHSAAPPKTTSGDTGTAEVPTNGYYCEGKPGDNLGLIIRAYLDQGVKLSAAQIKKANPKMNPDALIPGQKIFIPDPNAK